MSSPHTLKLAGHLLELEGTRQWCCTECPATFSEREVELMKAATIAGRREAFDDAAHFAFAWVGDRYSDAEGDNIADAIRAMK